VAEDAAGVGAILARSHAAWPVPAVAGGSCREPRADRYGSSVACGVAVGIGIKIVVSIDVGNGVSRKTAPEIDRERSDTKTAIACEAANL
jgi:hypothetical protein